MAKTTKKKKGNPKKGRMGMLRIDLPGLLGMTGGVFADKQFLDEQLGNLIKDERFKAVAKIAIGELVPKQKFVKDLIRNDRLIEGVGAALTVNGITELLSQFNITSGADDNDELAVVLDGADDTDMDDYDDMSDDIDTVNEDVLGEDDDYDDSEEGEDISTVAEDVLGDDEDDYGY